MDDFSIAGPPCPFCGAGEFAGHPTQPNSNDDFIDFTDAEAQYHPRVCTDCGNVQVLLTRGEGVAV